MGSRRKTTKNISQTIEQPANRALFPTWLYLLFIFGFSFALRLSIANIPLDRDEGEYAYLAQRWLKGELPYKTAFDQKPPATFLVYAFIQKCIGSSPFHIHMGTQIYTCLTIGMIFLLARKLFSDGAAVLASCVFAVISLDPAVTGNSSNTEIFMLLPLTGALGSLIRSDETHSSRWALATGVLCGISCLFKQVAVFNLLFAMAYLGYRSPKRLQTVFLVLGGALLIFGFTSGYFWMHHAWPEFYDCVIGYNLNYVSLVPLHSYPSIFWQSFSPHLQSSWPLYLLVLASLPFAFARGGPWRLLLGWALASFVGVSSGGFFRGHYFLQFFPAVSLIGAGALWEWGKRLWPLRLQLATAVVTLFVVAHPVYANGWYFKPGSAESKCRRIYGRNPFIESAQAGQFIEQKTTPEETIFIFGSEPQIFYYANRRSASRYIFVYPLLSESEDSLARQKSYLSDLMAQKPRHVVTIFIPTSFGVRMKNNILFNNIAAILNAHYRIVAVMPMKNSEAPMLVKGKEAERLWRAAPFWYEGNSWCAYAIWELNSP